MIKTITALGAAALAAFAFAVPAAAAQADAQDSVTVRYADLNLATAAGAARLDQRIRSAAREVCGEASGNDLQIYPRVNACKVEAIARAKASVEVAMRSSGGRVVALRTN